MLKAARTEAKLTTACVTSYKLVYLESN